MKLILDDGTVMLGSAFAATHPVAGEVVFNTAMSGYVETLTDPSYRGQILVLTYPMMGNYGVPAPRSVDSLDAPYESNRIQVQALVVQNYVDQFSHRSAVRSLGQWLRSEDVPGITGIDTRMLTRRLREHGTMKGWLIPADMSLDEAKRAAASIEMQREVFRLVAPALPARYRGTGPTIMVVDAGAKDHMVRSLLGRGAGVLRIPWHARLADYVGEVEGIVIGNGPGDPTDLGELVEQVRDLLQSFDGPVFGICLGNQILALAAGGSTYKLPYGHRGVNQPVLNYLTNQVEITTQNHGFAVRIDNLPPDLEPTHINLNDQTLEGMRHRRWPIFSVQYHPEAAAGPHDSCYLFEQFRALMG